MNIDRSAVAAPTRELAAWVARLRHADLPHRTREVVRCAILDTTGCGLYGYQTPWDTGRRVRLGMSKVVDVQCGFDYAPGSALNAQMSLRYIIAAALAEGQVLPPQFDDKKLSDPALLAQRTATDSSRAA